MSIIAALVLCGCSESPTKSAIKIDDSLLANWIASINKEHYACTKNGCRDFAVTCVRPAEVSKADQLNGVTERNVIGINFVGYNNASEYVDGKELSLFEKKKGVWKKIRTYSVTGIETCTYF